MIRRIKRGWQVDVRIGKGSNARRTRKSFATKAEAQEWKLRMKSQLQFSAKEVFDSASRTILDLIENYTTSDRYLSLRQSSRKRYGQIISRFKKWCAEEGIYLASHFGHKQAQLFSNFIRSKWSGRGIELNLVTISSIFGYELIQDNPSIARNPFAAIIKSSGRPSGIPRYFNWEELSAIRESMDVQQTALFNLLYYTGLRSGELDGLKWENVSTEGADIVNSAYHSTKTGEERRVPVERAKDEINYFKKIREDDFLIPRRLRNKSHYYLREWEKVKRKVAENFPNIDIADTTVHTWRKTCASHMLQKGVDITYVSKFLGHRSLETTIRYYGALCQQNLRDAASKLS